jgi:hypothetical protein
MIGWLVGLLLRFAHPIAAIICCVCLHSSLGSCGEEKKNGNKNVHLCSFRNRVYLSHQSLGELTAYHQCFTSSTQMRVATGRRFPISEHAGLPMC